MALGVMQLSEETIRTLSTTPPPRRGPVFFTARTLASAVFRVHTAEKALGLPLTPEEKLPNIAAAKERFLALFDLKALQAAKPQSSAPVAVATPPASAPVAVTLKPSVVPPVKPDLSHLHGIARASAANKLATGSAPPQNSDKLATGPHLKGLARALAAHAPITPAPKAEASAAADLATMRNACVAVLGFSPRAESPAAEQRAEIHRAFANAGVQYPGAPKIHQIERTGTARIMQARHQSALNKFLAANQTN